MSDDEGWRIEIPGVAGTDGDQRRSRTHARSRWSLASELRCRAIPQSPDSWDRVLHRADYIEIIKHAHSLHIDVIPEINLPAHARGAIIAMKAREKRLMAEGKPEEALKYRLHDPSDTSIYTSAQGFLDNAVCVTEEPVYAFAELILKNFEEMFQEADPVDRLAFRSR